MLFNSSDTLGKLTLGFLHIVFLCLALLHSLFLSFRWQEEKKIFSAFFFQLFTGCSDRLSTKFPLENLCKNIRWYSYSFPTILPSSFLCSTGPVATVSIKLSILYYQQQLALYLQLLINHTFVITAVIKKTQSIYCVKNQRNI